jgi:hypothetical protein
LQSPFGQREKIEKLLLLNKRRVYSMEHRRSGYYGRSHALDVSNESATLRWPRRWKKGELCTTIDQAAWSFLLRI